MQTEDRAIGTASVIFLDIEASGIARGCFPIEIGWAEARADASLAARSLLVRPAPPWLAEPGAWDPAAEAVHGLGLARLRAEGLAPEEACDVLDRAFAGRVVATDTGAGGWDADWLAMLFEAAGRAPRGWEIAEKPSGSHVAQHMRGLGLAPALVRPALKPFAPPHTHAAAEDALAFAWEWAMAAPLAAALGGRDAALALIDLPALLPRGAWPGVAPGLDYRRRHGG